MSKFVRANTNIALIKYWGKKDEHLKIPYTSSLSLTLNNLYTLTKVEYDRNLKEDVFVLNDEIQKGQSLKRVRDFMDEVRRRYQLEDYAKITSYNYVPTAAGLASSASAFAALAKASTLELQLSDVELSRLARFGSGSASRSIFEGLVQWDKGHSDQDSYARVIDNSWEDLRMIICLVNSKEKKLSSSEAMKKTVEESVYYPAWVSSSKDDLKQAHEGIELKDIRLLGEVIQRNALKMHASLMAVNEWYFEPKTIKIMNMVRELQNKIPVYFTMDAGPNVKLLTTKEYVDELINHLSEFELIVCEPGKGVTIFDED